MGNLYERRRKLAWDGWIRTSRPKPNLLISLDAVDPCPPIDPHINSFDIRRNGFLSNFIGIEQAK